MATPLRKVMGLALAGAVLTTLAGCGGCDSDPVYELKGVAATGLAIDGGSVAVTCAFGTGTATTAANGSYAISITDGVGPCLVTLTKGSLVLRSIAPASSTGAAVANITQISDAIVDGLVAAKGAASAVALVTDSRFTPSNTDLTKAVEATLVKINVELAKQGKPQLAAGTDLLGKPDFVAATTTTPSADPLDNALDVLVPSGTTALPTALVTAITTEIVTVVAPSVTGGTGGSGAGSVN